MNTSLAVPTCLIQQVFEVVFCRKPAEGLKCTHGKVTKVQFCGIYKDGTKVEAFIPSAHKSKIICKRFWNGAVESSAAMNKRAVDKAFQLIRHNKILSTFKLCRTVEWDEELKESHKTFCTVSVSSGPRDKSRWRKRSLEDNVKHSAPPIPNRDTVVDLFFPNKPIWIVQNHFREH